MISNRLEYRLVLMGLLLGPLQAIAVEKNGFLLDDALIEPAEIYEGGPPRDGIPALDDPVFVDAEDGGFIRGHDRVLGLNLNGVAKAYPIRILNYHEVVNDSFDGTPVTVTYCPLCGSGMAFSSVAAGSFKSFGVSGLLYNSDVLLYDRETESLWSQIMGKAVSGLLKGEELTPIALTHTTWNDWQTTYPGTLVLSTKTGHMRNYDRDPYEGYSETSGVMFPLRHTDSRYGAKELVVGVEIDGQFKAYPFRSLPRRQDSLNDKFAGEEISLVYDRQNKSAKVLDSSGKEIPTVTLYWFAWAAFHPETQVYEK